MNNRPKEVRAALSRAKNKTLIVENIQLPEKLYFGQVLVEIEVVEFAVHKSGKFQE